MSPTSRLVAWLWWGPARRPFEALARRTVGQSERIVLGPLRGATFAGGLAQLLGVYEQPVQEVLWRYLRPGSVFYDVGANNGYLTLLGAHAVGSRGHVYAFEPFPQNIAAIQRVISGNNLANCIVVPQAVADRVGKMPLYLAPGSSLATPSLLDTGAGRCVIEVPTVALDDVVQAHPWPDFIKVDVEGAEALVLAGAQKVLGDQNAPNWLIEVHDAEKEARVKTLLAAFDYRWQALCKRRGHTAYPAFLLAWSNK